MAAPAPGPDLVQPRAASGPARLFLNWSRRGWLLFLTVGPLLLAGCLCYLCRGPRQTRMTGQQLRDMQILSGPEQHEGLRF